jgi:putative tryptophan/tyrosine transport system substrate-binding protein
MQLGSPTLVAFDLLLALVSAPLAVEAQQAAKVYRIGVLETTSVTLNAANLEALRQGLRDLGYVEAQN